MSNVVMQGGAGKRGTGRALRRTATVLAIGGIDEHGDRALEAGYLDELADGFDRGGPGTPVGWAEGAWARRARLLLQAMAAPASSASTIRSIRASRSRAFQRARTAREHGRELAAAVTAHGKGAL